MVDRADRELVCETCQGPFIYSINEQIRDDRFGYPAPRLCPACAQQKRAARDAKRASRPFRRRNFRR